MGERLPPRLGVLRDFREEQWPSMDLVADMLLEQLRSQFSHRITAEDFCPAYQRWISAIPIAGGLGVARNAERLMNRMRNYPRAARAARSRFDLFHVADHSYAHLVHSLPAERSGVFCHDLDTFKSILDPGAEPRPAWFRKMTRHILGGLQKASLVFYSTAAVRAQIDAKGLIEPSRLVHAPYGVSREFDSTPVDPEPSREILREVFGETNLPFVLHVGSSIPRKRIDVLLDVFAELHHADPDLRLLQVGGDWTPAQSDQIRRLGIADSLAQRRGLSRPQLASLYRAASVVLQPSEAEGFGLPVIEALACGAAVVASDLPVLREVGGPAAAYCAVGDVAAWARSVQGILKGSATLPTRAGRLAWASRFTWLAHASTVLDAYLSLHHST